MKLMTPLKQKKKHQKKMKNNIFETLIKRNIIPQGYDCIITEAEYKGKKVTLNKPFKNSGGSKPYAIYVKNDKGNVIKVTFGSGMRAKLSDPDARKRFADRHNCDDKKDKTKPGYHSCRLPRYAKVLGLSYNGSARWW
jgi:hypothetical protein